MGKSARSSALKKNNSALKKRVFGPVELARSERLSAKLLELASQPKAPREEMEVDGAAASQNNASTTKDKDSLAMDVDVEKSSRSSSDKKAKGGRVQKSRHRKARNEIKFAKHPMKMKKKGRKS